MIYALINRDRLFNSLRPINGKIYKGWSWSILGVQNEENHILYWVEVVKGLEIKTLPFRLYHSNMTNYPDEEIAKYAIEFLCY